MKIQISPIKRIADALVVWPEAGPEVDLVIDPRPESAELSFRPGTIKTIYAFGILGITEPKNILPLLIKMNKALEPGGEIYIIENDFDYICRSYIGGDLPLSEFNNDFRKETYFSQNELVRLLVQADFPEKSQRVWHDGAQFKKEHYEIILSAKKPNYN